MGDEDFREELERLQDKALALTHVELKGLMLKATQIVWEAMDDRKKRFGADG